MYKSKLNEVCQKNRWRSPTYSFVKDGEEHNPSFRGSVVVNGFTFVSQSIFKSSKSAFNDAAQQALNHFTTFTLSTADVQNTKRQKVSSVSSSASDSDNDVPSNPNEFCSPDLAEVKTTTTPPDFINMDSYLLCNKVRVHTSIPTTTELPNGSVVLPIGDNKWTIVSLESD